MGQSKPSVKELLMDNLLLKEVEYKTEETNFGVWRRYGYINGTSYHEFKSHASWMGMPLVHYTYGRNPETGKRVCAKGVIAVGCFARGIVSVGIFSAGLLAFGLLTIGLITVGLVAIGVIFGLGQLATGVVALGQFAIGVLFAAGQFAIGRIAIGQFAFGKYVLAQIGFGEFVWSVKRADPEAIEFFKSLPVIRFFIP